MGDGLKEVKLVFVCVFFVYFYWFNRPKPQSGFHLIWLSCQRGYLPSRSLQSRTIDRLRGFKSVAKRPSEFGGTRQSAQSLSDRERQTVARSESYHSQSRI